MDFEGFGGDFFQRPVNFKIQLIQGEFQCALLIFGV